MAAPRTRPGKISVPVLLGSGERRFVGAGTDVHGLELVRTIAAPTVTHLTFVRR